MPTIIGVTGCTRAGKSWVAGSLASALQAAGTRVCVIGQDKFWQRAVSVKVKVDGKMTEMSSEEEPGCTDHQAFANAIRVQQAAGHHEVIIAEGYLLLHSPEVVELLDSIFLLEAEEHDARRRRTAPRSGLNSNPQTVEAFDRLTWPAHLRYLAASVDPLGARVRRLATPADAEEVAALVERIRREALAPPPDAGAAAAASPSAAATAAAAAAAAEEESLWPRAKLSWPADDGVGGGARQRALGAPVPPVAVLLTTGAMNPPHRGHAAMLHAAATRLRAAGYHVAGAYLSPSHDGYVQPKAQSLHTPGLSAPFRLAVARAAVRDDPLVSVAAWEAQKPGRWPDFPVVVDALRAELRDGPPCSVFYVCGTDHADRCGLWRGMGPGRGLVVVPRAAGARPRAASSERPEQLVYVARPAEGDAAALSSTAVRAALARRDHAAAAAMLSPAAADLLLRPGAREHARFAADYQALGV